MRTKKAYSYIRFSSGSQLYGHSIKRQTESAKKWAEENGYQLQDSIDGLPLADYAKSGFRSENVHQGALGVFLNLIKEGKVEKGSVLIVESLDRIGRDEALKAVPRFMDIINSGVEIVTLINKQHYRKGEFTYHDLSVTAAEMARAFDESQTKSERALANHREARLKARESQRLITSRIPLWLDYDKERKTVSLNEERAAIIREVVDDHINGDGLHKITAKLNGRKEPTWNRERAKETDSDGKRQLVQAKMWRKEFFKRLFANRQLVGEFQPKELKKDERGRVISKRPEDRTNVGDPIKNYFPAVITEEKFNNLQKAIASRRRSGRRPNFVGNLFPKIGKCAYCGSTMRFHNKGPNSKYTGYLVCDKAANKAGCDYVSLPLPPFERGFMNWCHEVDVKTLLGKEKLTEKLSTIDQEIEELKNIEEQAEKERQSLRLQAKYLKDEEEAEHNAQALNATALIIREAKERLAAAESRRIETISADQSTVDHLNAVGELRKKMKSAKTQEQQNEIRLKLRRSIAAVVEGILCFPDGLRNKMFIEGSFEITDYRDRDIDLELLHATDKKRTKRLEKKQQEAIQRHITEYSGRDQAFCIVRLKNGTERVLALDNERDVFVETMAVDQSVLKATEEDLVYEISEASR